MSTAEISSALSEANGILRRCEKSVSTPNEPFGALKRQMQAVTCAEQRRRYWPPEAVPYLGVNPPNTVQRLITYTQRFPQSRHLVLQTS